MENDSVPPVPPAGDGPHDDALRDGAPCDDALDPRAALALVADASADVADRVRNGPRWYDPAYGAAVGVFVLGYGLPLPWLVVALVVALAAFGAMTRAYTARTGIRFGLAAPRPRPLTGLTWAVVGVMLAGLAGSWLAGRGEHYLAVVGIAVVVAVAAGYVSHRYTVAQIALLDRRPAAGERA